MSLRPLLPWLLLAGALSIAAMVLGAGRGDKFNPALAAGLFAAAVIAAAVWINARHWLTRAPGPEAEQDVKNVLVSNVWLAALVYGWGALALFAVYSLSDLVWRHSWQYGLGAALFAAGVSLYAFRLDSTGDRAAPPFALTALHGLAAAAGLAYLIAEGKLATHRGDWAANDVFLAGGIAIILLCVIAGFTQKRAPKQAT